ncbi:MAG: hypothetical protein KDA47_20770, partial [Planctomycetales bacterium]|nr:hypothetical protein [Planctomycetales bacterium]
MSTLMLATAVIGVCAALIRLVLISTQAQRFAVIGVVMGLLGMPLLMAPRLILAICGRPLGYYSRRGLALLG